MSWLPSTGVLVALAVGAAVLLILAGVTVVVLRRRARRDAARPTAQAVAASAPATPEPVPEARAEPVPVAPDIAGSSAPLAAALSRALAKRPAPRGDARDRLLAVLLDDPVRTVGAAAALEASSAQLSRLSEALSHERSVVREHLAKLAAAGLEPDQLASLSGLPAAEVRALLSR
ncbi:hypothetical protein SAMN05443637_10651 [Pseudonocardia thermophila]|uniref:Uncharacterized protein n=1 Tax=Pseudonocardia thermophila TaxID=1848 RepID=A0A1M6SBP2_PSETH|nr:hypothetical protein [Pseudonocardia thermophila]SHK42116.1 hypothetical protein SAMN05443637_10651 [Pseudonocardia thermophila]